MLLVVPLQRRKCTNVENLLSSHLLKGEGRGFTFKCTLFLSGGLHASRVTLETLRNIAQEHVIMFSILRSFYVSERDANIQYNI